jgi:signal transduction histidine kinase/CheY-like chemotaxis protein
VDAPLLPTSPSPAAPREDRTADAPSPQDDASDIERFVGALQERVLRAVRAVVTWGGVPALALFATLDLIRGRGSPWVWAELGALVAVSLSTRGRASLRVRALAFAGLLLAASAMSLAHFGPGMGTGLMFLLSTLLAAFFFGARGPITAVGLLSASHAVIGYAAVEGYVAPVMFSPTPLDWVRMWVATVLVLTASGALFVLGERTTRGAIEAELEARRRARETSAERERILRTAERAQRLEALGRLAGGVAHDFNNALLVIQGSVELLRITRDPAEHDAILGEIEQGIERASATARQLLTFARQRIPDGRTTLPDEQLAHLGRSVGRLLPAHVALVFDAGGVPPVDVSPAAFEQIFLNLILNARDAIPRAGKIQLRTSTAKNGVHVEVIDDGIGMTPEVRARIFEPFFTTKGERGTGLGLATVWSIVHGVGGVVDVESEPGRGTSFRVTLPIAKVQGELPDETPFPLVVDGVEVLFLEDQPEVARVVKRMLTQLGFAVVHVARVEDALRALDGHDFGLLVTDGNVPGGPVGQVIEKHRATRGDAPVVLCTGFVEEELALASVVERTTVHRLAKPFSRAELADSIVRALGLGP